MSGEASSERRRNFWSTRSAPSRYSTLMPPLSTVTNVLISLFVVTNSPGWSCGPERQFVFARRLRNVRQVDGHRFAIAGWPSDSLRRRLAPSCRRAILEQQLHGNILDRRSRRPRRAVHGSSFLTYTV